MNIETKFDSQFRFNMAPVPNSTGEGAQTPGAEPAKEQAKKVVDRKISSSTLVSRNQRNGTLHIKIDK